MRKALMLTAAVLAAVFVWVLATLPPSPAIASGTVGDEIRRRTVPGAFHVHSERSDGIGDRAVIAAAAARAGLRFVVMTDHGDGTRPPDAPAYVGDVLLIDAVEISTNGGHYIALDMPAAPYRLGGEASAVVEDVRRLGGFGIVAHPDSSKPELKWTAWDTPFDGVEWLNFDSEWRDEPRRQLARAAIDYMFRSGPALASLLDRPSTTLARLDAMAAKRSIVSLAGEDAHGGWASRLEDGERQGLPGFPAGIPSYEASFRTFAIRAVLDSEFSGHAERDAKLLLGAIRRGRVFTSVDACAQPAWVDYRVVAGVRDGFMGDVLPFAEGAALAFRSTMVSGSRIVLLRDGVEMTQSTSGELRALAPGPGAYRVEVSAPRAPGTPPVPWIVTNPIYLTGSLPEPDLAETAVTNVLAVPGPGRIEKDPGSIATLSVEDGRHIIEYQLRSGERASQYVALVFPFPQAPPAFNAIAFDARSSAPMRVSVQLRFDRLQGARLGQSVFVSPVLKHLAVPLDRLVPLDPMSGRPSFNTASSILLVVDLTNTPPGGKGRFEISELTLAAGASSSR